jgi:Neuraminidase (sialidase)
MCGKYSTDNGKTWGDEFTLRDAYKSTDGWADMGYPRLVQRPDAKLVALYYWASEEHPQQHIAATIWTP